VLLATPTQQASSSSDWDNQRVFTDAAGRFVRLQRGTPVHPACGGPVPRPAGAMDYRCAPQENPIGHAGHLPTKARRQEKGRSSPDELTGQKVLRTIRTIAFSSFACSSLASCLSPSRLAISCRPADPGFQDRASVARAGGGAIGERKQTGYQTYDPLSPEEEKWFLVRDPLEDNLETWLHVGFARWPVERTLQDKKSELGRPSQIRQDDPRRAMAVLRPAR
jgi:hypothetical protein